MQTRREGIALILVIMLILVTATITAGAAMLGSGSWLTAQYKERQGSLQAIADAGLEEGRARINGDKTLYPDTLYSTLENGVTVTDAAGTLIPGVRRWIYAGPIGVTTGQYGVFGSVVSVAQAGNGDKVVRRLEIVQESFAKYAYFTDIEPASISFGGGDVLFGPVHSNDNIKINNTGATFNGPVETAGTVSSGKIYGTFNSTLLEHGPHINMPQTADLNKLRGYAQQGSTAFVGNAGGAAGQASTRIEFVNVDLNGDGDATDDDEGFMRVYQNNTATGPEYIVADVPAAGMRSIRNCGDYHNGVFVSAAAHPVAGVNPALGGPPYLHSWFYAMKSMPNRGCLLGGDDRLQNGFVAADAAGGRWLPWPGAINPRLAVAGTPGFRADRAYLFPISRALNPNFKGVIFVDGKVAINGTLRGRITLASTSSIIVVDDMRYATDPGAGTCVDMLGLFAGVDVIVADNMIQAPHQVNGSVAWYTYDDTPDEFIHGVVLALNNFTVENYGAGATNAQACGATAWGRGCLFLTGGVIQKTRGAVATSGGTGNLKRYSYDSCAGSDPPPYFPTTGHFARARTFEVPAAGFDVARLFDALTPN